LTKTLVAFTTALTGDADAAPDVAARIDAWLADAGRKTRAGFTNALVLIEAGTLASRYVRPFSMLGPAAGAGAAPRLRHSRLASVRAAAEDVAREVMNQWAARPEVEQAIGFTYGCVTDDAPREGAPLEVLSYPQIYRPHTEDCDVVVVGSGAGGAVAAAELAEQGLSVVVVEEGGLHTRADFGGAPAERARRMHRRIRAPGTPSVDVLMGFGLGGSTLVSYGSMYRPPDDVLTAWANEHGIDGADPASMRPYFDRIERAQDVTQVSEALIGEAAKRVRDATRTAGLHGGGIRRAVRGCRGCGTCSVGCPSDAKLSTHLTFLPRAQRRGATLFANAQVRRIVIEEGRARGIEATLVDQRTREAKTTLSVRAKAVVLAAGAIHTPVLLAANALGNRSGLLGRGLSLLPGVTVVGTFADEMWSWRGAMQPFALDEWLDSTGVMVEVTDLLPSLDASLFGRDALERLPRSAGLTVSLADRGRSEVASRADGPSVRAVLAAQDRGRLVRGVARAAGLWLAAGAREVLVPFARAPITTEAQIRDLDGAPLPRTTMALRSLGPSGSARMGRDPATSVVSPTAQVHGVPGLFVADASALPTSPGVAPQATVMAMAARAAEHVAAFVART
jgi:choline dehydrogenase-like flavoprotein